MPASTPFPSRAPRLARVLSWVNRFALLLLLAVPARAGEISPPDSQARPANPHRGFMMWGTDYGAGPVDNPHGARIYHVYVPWRELERADQVFAFDAFEANHLEPILADHPDATFVLRLVADYPDGENSGITGFYEGGELRRDYPKFLEEAPLSIGWEDYESCNGDGPGRTPDWNDPGMVAQMEELITAFAARYDGDPRLTTIQVGLLGLWGEWHQSGCEALAPSDATRQAVRDRYAASFRRTPLQTRYSRDPDVVAVDFGFHEDYFPSFTGACVRDLPLCDDTGDWNMEWAFTNEVPEARDNWKVNPISGESPLDEQKESWIERTADIAALLRDYHFSFLGPAGAHEEPGGEAELGEIDRHLGYALRLRRAKWPDRVVRGEAWTLELDLANTGVAPHYHAFPVRAELVDEEGRVARSSTLAVDLGSVLPAEVRTFSTELASGAVPPGVYSLRIAAIDPRTGEPGLRFESLGHAADGTFPLGAIELREPAPSGRRRLLLPGQARAAGALGTAWFSELWLFNPGPARTVDLSFWPQAADNSAAAPLASFELGEGEIRHAPDVIALLGLSPPAIGTVVVEAAGEAPILAGARTFNSSGTSTYGQYIWSITGGGATPLLLPGARRSADFRTNLGLVNPGLDPIAVVVDLLGRTRSFAVAPRSNIQLNDVFTALGIEGDGLGTVSVSGAEAYAYLSIVDNRTGDPTYIGPIAPRTDGHLLGCARGPGRNGTEWYSDLVLANQGGAAASVELTYLPNGRDNAMVAPAVALGLAAGETRLVADVVGESFGAAGVGTVHFSASGPVLAWVRTYNRTSGGETFGQPILPVSTAEMAAAGQSGVYLFGIASGSYRANVAGFNPSLEPTELTLVALDAANREIGRRSYAMPPRSGIQVTNVLPELGLASGLATVVATSNGPSTGYLSMVDNVSGDGITVFPGIVDVRGRTHGAPPDARACSPRESPASRSPEDPHGGGAK